MGSPQPIPARTRVYSVTRAIRGQEVKFRELWESGITVSEIGDRFGVSAGAVWQTVYALGLQPRGKGAQRRRSMSIAAVPARVEACRWIEGDDFIPRLRAGFAIFCGADLQPGSSYCARHHARCYVLVAGRVP